jgi:hypothetical protein
MAHVVDAPSAQPTGTPETADAGWPPKPIPSRIFVRCYGSYHRAAQAYDRLRFLADIPERRMTVVARGLRWREPLSTGALIRLGATLAGVVGAAVGLILWALGDSAIGWLGQSVLGGVFGAATGMLGALALAWARGRRAELVTTGHVEPSQYDILVEEELAPAARKMLADGHG